MTPVRFFHIEALYFLYALAATIAALMLTRRINTAGLLLQIGPNGQLSPGRVQLLMTTLAACASYLTQAANATDGKLPDVSANWLYVFGGSGSIYALEKAWVAWSNRKKS